MGAVTFDLHNPRYSVHERAGLGGLACTVRAFQDQNNPVLLTLKFELKRTTIRVSWECDDIWAISRLLDASFRLTEFGLIDLPGMFAADDSTRIAHHSGILSTFLQHPKTYESGKVVDQPFEFSQFGPVNEKEPVKDAYLTYKTVLGYPHQTGCGLVGAKRIPETLEVSQTMVPGVVSGSSPAIVNWDQALLLNYLIVSCHLFTVAPPGGDWHHAVVMPDVDDLIDFSSSVMDLAAMQGRDRWLGLCYDFGNYVSRAEEGALRYIVAMATHAKQRTGVRNCTAMAMRRVAWDKKQVNRVGAVTVKCDYPNIQLYRLATIEPMIHYIVDPKTNVIRVICRSFVPGLVASNLVRGKHWLHGMDGVLNRQDAFRRFRYDGKRCNDMMPGVTEEDALIIKVVQEAWRSRLGEVWDSIKSANATGRPDHVRDKFQRNWDRMWNDIRRPKTTDKLVEWLLMFVSKHRANKAIRDSHTALARILFNYKHVTHLRNLILFALNSYESDNKANRGGEVQPPVSEALEAVA